MPQIVLEYSTNIGRPVEADIVLGELAEVISAAAGIDISNFKSRLVRREEYLVGRSGSERAFVHLEVGILSGKTPETKRRIGENCLEYLKKHFEAKPEGNELVITLEIREMDRDTYYKSETGKTEGGQDNGT